MSESRNCANERKSKRARETKRRASQQNKQLSKLHWKPKGAYLEVDKLDGTSREFMKRAGILRSSGCTVWMQNVSK